MHFLKCVCVLAIGWSIFYRALSDVCKQDDETGENGLLCVAVASNPDEQLVHVLSSADVARRLMLIAKRDKWQFVVKT
jgi:hypothetical protein